MIDFPVENVHATRLRMNNAIEKLAKDLLAKIGENIRKNAEEGFHFYTTDRWFLVNVGTKVTCEVARQLKELGFKVKIKDKGFSCETLHVRWK